MVNNHGKMLPMDDYRETQRRQAELRRQREAERDARVKAARNKIIDARAAGWTVRSIATATGISMGSVSNIGNGHPVSMVLIAKVAAADLDVPASV